MTVQPDLCWTCSENTLFVFPRGGLNVKASNGDSPTTSVDGVAVSVPIGRLIVRLEVLRNLVQDL